MLIFLCALLFIPPPFFRSTIQTGTDDEFTHFAIQIRRRRPSFYAFLLIRYSPFFFGVRVIWVTGAVAAALSDWLKKARN